jgi:hypothetical protein
MRGIKTETNRKRIRMKMAKEARTANTLGTCTLYTCALLIYSTKGRKIVARIAEITT